jgi:hypothetical protein
MEDTAQYMTAPTTNGEAPLPRRAGIRGLLPSTWLSRGVRCRYTDGDGRGQETSAVLLDWCGAGVLLDIAGSKTLLS